MHEVTEYTSVWININQKGGFFHEFNASFALIISLYSYMSKITTYLPIFPIAVKNLDNIQMIKNM